MLFVGGEVNMPQIGQTLAVKAFLVMILYTDWSIGLGENRLDQSFQPIKHLAVMLSIIGVKS